MRRGNLRSEVGHLAIFLLTIVGGSLIHFASTENGAVNAVAAYKTSAQKAPVLATATDASFTDLSRSAAKSTTTADALLQYKTFRHTHRIPPSLQPRYDEQYKVWKDRATQNLIRLGNAWVPPENAQSVATEADKLIEEAFESVDSGNHKRARDLLLKASHLDTAGIRADFVLGLLNTPLAANHFQSAQQHFVEVLNRWPNHVPALNNLALIEVRMRRHDTALGRWEAALNAAPKCDSILHNLRRYLDEARKGTIAPSTAQVKRATSLLANQTEDPRPGRGWLYMPLVLPVPEGSRTTLKKNSTKITVGHGSGFVIAPGLVLTTWHAVEDAEELLAGTRETGERSGRVVAFNPELDIALVEFEGLHAEPLKLAKLIPLSGGSPFRIALDRAALLSTSPPTVSGQHFKVSDDKQYLYLTGNLDPGSEGGAIFDFAGNVVALHMGHFKLESGAISVGLLVEPILQQFQVRLAGVTREDSVNPLSSSEINQLALSSTVSFRCLKATYAIGSGDRPIARLATLDDISCSACAGSGRTACIARGCNEGVATTRVAYQEMHGIGAGQHAVTRYKTLKIRCQKCGGDGLIPCQHCRGFGTGNRKRPGLPQDD